MKYTYGVSITILETIESDVPLDPEDCIDAAFEKNGIDRGICNDIEVTGLNGTPDPYLGYIED